MHATSLDALAIYVLMAYRLLQNPRSEQRDAMFAMLNAAFTFVCFFLTGAAFRWESLLLCVCIVSISYLVLHCHAAWRRCYTAALGIPLLFLVLSRTGYLPAMAGISYMALRLSYLAFELENRKISLPSFANYCGFALFPLTYFIGPITPYRLYDHSLENPSPIATPLLRSFARILVGLLKCFLLSELFRTLDISHLWFDGYYHGLRDFITACACTYLNLYFTFSGGCDLIIGGAGILGIRIKENFNAPLAARNLQEFWNRFHITLSDYMRDIVFLPGLLALTRKLGPRRIALTTVAMILASFFLIGLWHGFRPNFMILGLLHGIGMSLFYLFCQVEKRLPDGLRRFIDGPFTGAFSTGLTFLYVSFTSIFLACDWEQIKSVPSLFIW